MSVKRLTGFIFVGMIAGLSAAHAQMAVIDNSNLSQNMQTAAQALIEVAQLKAQLQQLQQQYQMFTNPTDIMSMVPDLHIPSVENPMPTTGSVAGLIGGSASGSQSASTYYQQNHVYTPTNSSPDSQRLLQHGQAIANIQGMAQDNLAAVEQRLSDIPDLENQLQSATSITQVSAINGRIAAEQQFVQGQQAQAANLQVLATEQQAVQQQQQQEESIESDDNELNELKGASNQ